MDCYNIEQEDLLKNLRTSSNGLSEKEAAKRLKDSINLILEEQGLGWDK